MACKLEDNIYSTFVSEATAILQFSSDLVPVSYRGILPHCHKRNYMQILMPKKDFAAFIHPPYLHNFTNLNLITRVLDHTTPNKIFLNTSHTHKSAQQIG